jgi:mannose-6-phosphate isomerase-like protein (cupin superfamily)
MSYKFTKDKARHFRKAGVEMWVYSDEKDNDDGSIVYQEVNGVHEEEIVNKKSSFIYHIIEGKGIFFIEDKEYPVSATDVIIIPPGKRFYYSGKMKQSLVVAPSWEEENEKIIRKVNI